MQNAHDSPQNAQIKNKRVLVRITVHLCCVSRAFDTSLARLKEVADEKKISTHVAFRIVAENFLPSRRRRRIEEDRAEDKEEAKRTWTLVALRPATDAIC
jgi:hypothetical protein